MEIPVYKTEIFPVDQLIPYVNNSRVHSEYQIRQIANSIETWGFTMPILIADDNTVIAGHARLEAAKLLGLSSVPVMVANGWSDDQMRAYVIADNKLATNSSWDDEILRNEIEMLKMSGFELGVMGFDESEIDALLNALQPVSGKTDPDKVPPKPKEPFVKEGETWDMGPHSLWIGDSLDAEAVAAFCAPDEVALWLTDPPYNVDYHSADGKSIQGDKQEDAQFRAFLRDAYLAADKVLRKGGVFYVWYADTEAYNFHGACRDIGWRIRQVLVWRKSSFVLGKQDYQWQHESSLYGNKEGGDVAWYFPEHEASLYGWKDGAGHEWHSDRKQTTVMDFDKPPKNADHPTMKPVALFRYQMENSTAAGEVVLDSFAGSGTTLIAAAQTARKARLIELDPVYAEVILRRWVDFSGEQPVLRATGQSFEEVEAERKSEAA